MGRDAASSSRGEAGLKTPASAEQPASLLQRDEQLAQIMGWLRDAVEGKGRVGLIIASAGLGKTSLLQQSQELARDYGLRDLSARGSELEREMSFGVARQLFDRTVAALEEPDRGEVLSGAAAAALSAVGAGGEASSSDPAGVIHGLYWLATNLADREPLFLAVDDAHWADAQTLRWLIYLAPRVAGTSIFTLVAGRPREPGAESMLLTALAEEEAIARIGLEPLEARSVGELVRHQLGRSADPAFVQACTSATGGNPFFVREVLRAAASEGIEPAGAQVSRVSQLTTPLAGRSILVRLARLGAQARRVAEAVAVCGPDAELRHVAALAELSVDEALGPADALADAEILTDARPLEFIHPIARAAVYEQMARGERGSAHRRVAAMLADEGATSERVALHLLASEHVGDPWVVERLREAADAAVGAGAPDAAARYLRRALAEPPDPGERARVQFELGRALAGIDVAGAAASFAEATASEDRSLSILALRWRGQALAFGGQPGEAVGSLDRAIELARDDDEQRLLLEATRDFYALGWTSDPDWAERSRRLQERAAHLEGATPGERRTLAVAAHDIARVGMAPAAKAIELANRVRSALATWLDADAGIETAGGIGESSIIADDPEALVRHERAVAEAVRRGLTHYVAGGGAQIAHIAFRRGELLEAEAEARRAWQLVEGEREAAFFYWWCLLQLVDVLVARGELDEARALVESTGLEEEDLGRLCFWPTAPPAPVVLGELALAEGRLEEGVNLLLEGGRWLEERGWANPALNPWRARVAPALAMAGHRDEALDTIESAVEVARRFGAPWALGMALRAAGTVEQGERGIGLLMESVGVLDRARCRLEHAHALLELGAALRRANERAQAKGHLSDAMEIARVCGAIPLAERARQELEATGARPRRLVLSGVESLTASERRVAQMAADGKSNPEIAQSLFVTRRTVETHLTSVYRKLEISSRKDLAAALEERAPAAVG